MALFYALHFTLFLISGLREKFLFVLETKLGQRMANAIEEMTKLLENMPMGDNCKPSELLDEMRARAGTVVDDNLLRQLWIRNLPETVRAILLTGNGTTLDEDVVKADRVDEAIRQGFLMTGRRSAMPASK